jgi:hypothetical protein
MNSLQKRSLLITIILGLQYFLAVVSKLSLFFILATLLVTLIAGWIYSLGLSLDLKSLYKGLIFLLLPILFNFGALFFVLSIMIPAVAYILVILALLGNYYLYIALRRVYNLEDKAAIFQRNILISIAFVSVFLSIAILYRFYVNMSVGSGIILPLSVVIILTALIFYAVSYFLAWENGVNMKKFMPYNLVISLLGAEVAWTSSIWIVNYPMFSNFQKAGLSGIPIPAVTLAIIFYFCWGVISHKSDRSLTRNVMFEYFILTIIFLSVLFATTQWIPQT